MENNNLENQKYIRAQKKVKAIKGFYVHLLVYLGVNAFLILARIIGGIMGGNLSVATAVVADVTTDKNRSKGMAFVGIAFAFGFIFGPALGGLLSLIDLTQIFPGSEVYGINPFSAPAILAAILSFINFFFILRSIRAFYFLDDSSVFFPFFRSRNISNNRSSLIVKV